MCQTLEAKHAHRWNLIGHVSGCAHGASRRRGNANIGALIANSCSSFCSFASNCASLSACEIHAARALCGDVRAVSLYSQIIGCKSRKWCACPQPSLASSSVLWKSPTRLTQHYGKTTCGPCLSLLRFPVITAWLLPITAGPLRFMDTHQPVSPFVSLHPQDFL